MRASTAYFAGAGTIIAAIAAGVGGGLLVGDIISPKSTKQTTEMSRLERRMSREPIPAASTPSEPVPYLSTPQPSQPSTTVAAAPAPVQAQTDTANASPPAAKQPEIRQPETPASQSASQPGPPAAQPVAREQTSAPNDALLAKARDADIKRADDRRKAERRQQWAERRRQRQQQELQAVEERVREDTEPRREFVGEPVRVEMPRIRLFGPD
jgi:hypothetical protein